MGVWVKQKEAPSRPLQSCDDSGDDDEGLYTGESLHYCITCAETRRLL